MNSGANAMCDDDVIIESSNSGTTTPMVSNPGTPRSVDPAGDVRNTPPPVRHHYSHMMAQQQPQSKYASLLAVIEDMGKDIRPTYSGSKTSAERLKRGIINARILVRECIIECEKAAKS